MAGITLVQADAKLQLYLSAIDKILAGQKVEIDGQAITRANLADVERAIDFWDRRVKTLSAATSGRGRLRTIAPLG